MRRNPQKEIGKNMKIIKPLIAGVAAMVIAGGFALSAQATLITGMLNISGTATYDAPIATATQVTQLTTSSLGAQIPGALPASLRWCRLQ